VGPAISISLAFFVLALAFVFAPRNPATDAGRALLYSVITVALLVVTYTATTIFL